MKITVAKQDMEKALQVAGIGIAGSGADLSTHFIFRIRDKKVEILSSNQRICTAVFLNCQYEADEDEAMTIEGWRLLRWLGGTLEAALVFEDDGAEIKAASPRNTIRMKGLDAAKFPYWDKTLSEAKEVGTISSDRLASALKYASHFISDKDTTRPEISQAEMIDGCLWATDKKAVTLIALEGLDKSSFRINGKDIGAVLKFLSLAETGDVSVLEHERMVIFRRDDDAMVGAARPIPEFPSLNMKKDTKVEGHWEVTTADLLEGFQCLSASSDKDDTRVQFAFDPKKEQIVMSVASSAGGRDQHVVDCVSHENVTSDFEAGFEVDYPYISDIIGHFGGDTLTFGLIKKRKGGYIRFAHTVGDDKITDEFVTVVVWRL